MPKKSTKPSARRIKSFRKENGREWHAGLFRVVNADGIHTRPAAAFVKLAQRFPSEVRVYKKKQCADGKSILNILSLGAEKGTAITIKTRGLKSKEALRALGKLIRAGFNE